jgi:hypothetical protein
MPNMIANSTTNDMYKSSLSPRRSNRMEATTEVKKPPTGNAMLNVSARESAVGGKNIPRI